MSKKKVSKKKVSKKKVSKKKVSKKKVSKKKVNLTQEEMRTKLNVLPDDSNKVVALVLESFFKDQEQYTTPETWKITPSSLKRRWMEETGNKFSKNKKEKPHAYKCLPLCMANTSGWNVHCPVGFSVMWNGDNRGPGAIRFKFDENAEYWSNRIIERFGVGTFTIPVPYVFRTRPGIQMSTRGPMNSWKQNAQSLDAITETDWLPYPFFQTWKILRAHEWVRFEKGEPYAHLSLVDSNLISNAEFSIEDITAPEWSDLHKETKAWSDTRTSFQNDLFSGDPERIPDDNWQKDYMVGRLNDGSLLPKESHKTSYGQREVSKCPFSNLFKGKEKDG